MMRYSKEPFGLASLNSAVFEKISPKNGVGRIFRALETVYAKVDWRVFVLFGFGEGVV